MVAEAHILLVELRRGKAHSFGPELLKKGHSVIIAKTGRKAKETLSSFKPHVIVLDTAFSSTNGARTCTMLRATAPRIPLIYICEAGRVPPPSIRAEITLVHPFTIRKLSNRINRLLPSTDSPTLQAGPITLILDKRSLVKNQREHRLTPKQAQLLELFMQRPGQVISRRELMNVVWETDFMDDTRTLDVHIRWVREAIEDNPSKPRYLTTIRGKGYKFAIPAEEINL